MTIITFQIYLFFEYLYEKLYKKSEEDRGIKMKNRTQVFFF